MSCRIASYDNNGFLGERIKPWIRNHRRETQELFNRCELINRNCHEFLDAWSVDRRSLLEITSSVFFIRSLELYQAVILLLGHGMHSGARILLRAQLEALFTLGAICECSDMLDRFLDEHQIVRKKIGNRILKSTSKGLAKLRLKIDEKSLLEIKQKIADSNIHHTTVEEFARAAGLHDIYATAYVCLSGAVHSTAYDLEGHLDDSPDNSAKKGFAHGPSAKETGSLLTSAGIAMALTLELVSGVSGDSRKSDCARHKAVLQELHKKHQNTGSADSA